MTERPEQLADAADAMNEKLQRAAETFSDRFPKGTKMRYWEQINPRRGEIRVTIDSNAWVKGGCVAVVQVLEIGGAVRLDHLTPILPEVDQDTLADMIFLIEDIPTGTHLDDETTGHPCRCSQCDRAKRAAALQEKFRIYRKDCSE